MDNWTPDQIVDELIRLMNEAYPALKEYTSIVVFYITVRRALSIGSYFNKAGAYSIEKVADIIEYMA